jgi:hypothetical protein
MRHQEDTVLLHDLAFARPGDKGDASDITVFARTAEAYAHLRDVLTVDVVRAHYGELVQGEVTRWEVPNVWALKFLLEGALAGGGPASLRADNLGKALGGAILRLRVPALPDESTHRTTSPTGRGHPPVPGGAEARGGRAGRAPSDPYADATWRVR